MSYLPENYLWKYLANQIGKVLSMKSIIERFEQGFMSILNISINEKPFFLSEVVTFENNLTGSECLVNSVRLIIRYWGLFSQRSFRD